MPMETPSRADRDSPAARDSRPVQFSRAGSGRDLGTRSIARDCLQLFPRVASGSIDLVFADPPFNIGSDYLRPTWTQELLVRVLAAETGVTVSVTTMSRLLKRHRMRLSPCR